MTDQLQKDEMMKHLMDALERGQDIGHYGRLVFIMGARPFLNDSELAEWLTKDKDCGKGKADSLIQQVAQRNYNPPRREKVLEWMQRQGFPICPNPSNPDSCNLYKTLEFPSEVYDHIEEYRNEKDEMTSVV